MSSMAFNNGVNPSGQSMGTCGAGCACTSCGGGQASTALANTGASQFPTTPMAQDSFTQQNMGLSATGLDNTGQDLLSGVSSSTLMLMTQINMMLANVMMIVSQALMSLMQGSGSSGSGDSASALLNGFSSGAGSTDSSGSTSGSSSGTGATSLSNTSDTAPIPAGRNPDGSNVRATQTMEDYKERFGITNLGIWGDEAHKKRKSDHNTGDAADLGIKSTEHGNEVTAALVAEADARGIKYIIFNGKIWSADKRDQGWRDFSGDPHRTHVHVSFNT